MTTILIVDDEPAIETLVSMCLDDIDVEVVIAKGRDEALSLARSRQIDLVLLDLALGGEDGLDILPDLRADPGLKDVPVVAFTAHDSRRKEAIESGVDSFLARPFARDQLRAAVQEHLASR